MKGNIDIISVLKAKEKTCLDLIEKLKDEKNDNAQKLRITAQYEFVIDLLNISKAL